MTDNSTYKPKFQKHDLIWTDEKISRFWNFLGERKEADDLYFSRQVGDELIKFTEKFIKFNGAVLDYGSGKGFLIEYLLNRGIKSVSGCDFSIESIDEVNRKFDEFPNFDGCTLIDSLPSSFDSDKFNCIFFLEVVEHLSESFFNTTLMELSRIAKKGGYLVVSTRNDENLEQNKIMCLNCGAIFHRVQHLRKFNKSIITNLFSKYGFEEVFCGAIKLVDYKKSSYHLIKRLAKDIFKKQYNRPDLIYIGIKI